MPNIITNGSWFVNGNWDLGVIPNAFHEVSVGAVGEVTINNNAIANSVFIEVGGKLTQNSGTLSVAEDFTIESTAAGTGSFIHKGTLEVGGDITVERFFGTAETWRLVSSPVANQAVSGSWIPSGGYADGTGYDFYAWHEPSETWRNQKVPANAITAFVPGTGYLVSFEDPNLLKTFSGALNKGTVPVAVTREGSGQYSGSNLIGNPYASGIDWNQADRTLFEDNFAYVYDRNTGEHGTTEGYLPVDGSAPDAWIGAHQGFFVLVKDEAKTNFEFTEDMMAHGGAFTKEQPEWEQLILHLNNDTHYHQTTIRLNEASEFDRDRTDAIHFFSMNPAMPQIYSFTSDQAEVAINSIPYIDEENPVDLGLYLPEAGTFTLSLRELSGRFNDLVPYLEDLGEDRMINLKSEGEYSFSAWQGTLINRFRLHLKSGDTTTSVEEAEPNLNRMWFHDNKLFVDAAEILDVGVYDVSGRRLGSYRALAGQHVFPLQLAAGVYVVSLDGNTHRETLRIVVR
ncbi:MAG: T9SS type A sorting domain-containing protein [Bacteroidales bacterium]|nr:T9SS type A sorting domain-containing protein [Bacteroidales bacterium]